MHLSICMISISRIELLAVQWAVSTPAPRAPGWSFTISCGFCVLQRVGTGYIQPLTSPQPQEKRAFSWEREDPLSGPTLSTQSHIPRDAFPTMNQTCYSVHFWKNAKGVGDHLSGVLPSTHGRLDLWQIPQLGHSPQVRENMERALI